MSNRTINFLRIAMVILMLLSMGLLIWQHFGMSRVLRIDTQTPYQITALDDRSQGGASVAKFARNQGALQLQCDLQKNQYEWPFCEMSIALSNTAQGVDLSKFDRVVFDMDLRGPEFKKVRVYLRNFEADISKLDDPLSSKVNELEFAPPKGEAFSVPLKYFRVASWWVDDRDVPIFSSDMRLDNVTQIEIATPGKVQTGLHQIEMRALEFHGKWLSLTQVLTLIVAAWLIFCFVWLFMELLAYRERDQTKRARMHELETINRVLEIQAEVLSNKIQLDPLTGALNREGLRDFLLQQWQGEMPMSAGMSVLFADLDHFKRVNDHYGHAVGDTVLRQFAQLVLSEIRSSDALVRWGGEEFLVVCPNTDLAQAAKLAEKLRASVANAAWPDSMTVTCSCGVAMRAQGEEFSSLIERADAALYRAKDNGRNRVELG
ncbi:MULTISPECIES: GGDEF domain-containing protein [Deefgea]|uniref:diguanylate cyclase n=1 Tax=Deefgea chitinilytica TaxID=570276 RepID=A0ABS2CDC1_9NEIS|nr:MULTISPECIES: GGDEF domain-containing protein [Deefgea]MBM5571463.1 diguanylate cyclase [Deefgea chitinilytica]MBM9888696.1 GGDEF domain-containing protein [Deefgea sp. CFH1-16]